MIGGENPGRASQPEEESILESKHGGRSDNSGFREDQTGILLSSSLILAESKISTGQVYISISSTNLGAVVLGRRVQIRIETRDLNKPVTIILRDSFRNPLCALYMYIFIGKVPIHHLSAEGIPRVTGGE